MPIRISHYTQAITLKFSNKLSSTSNLPNRSAIFLFSESSLSFKQRSIQSSNLLFTSLLSRSHRRVPVSPIRYNYLPHRTMKVHIQVIGMNTGDSAPALMVTTDTVR